MWQVNNQCPLVHGISEPKIFKVNEFTQQALHAFQKTINYAISVGQPIINIYIESDGGDVNVLNGFLSMMDYGRKNGLQFAGFVSGCAASAGAMVFLYCDFRFMGSSANLMVHNIQLWVQGKNPDLHSEIKFVGEMEVFIFEKLSRWIKKPKDWLKKQLERRHNSDWNINSTEALSLKIIEHIGIPMSVFEIKSTYYFKQ